MAKRRLDPMHDEHVNVTPLIDVVMCLIIFFLMVGKLVKDENSQGLNIPKAHLGQEMEDQQGRLTINVVPAPSKDEHGELIPLDHRGNPTVKLHGQDVITAQSGWKELTERLRQEKSANPDLKVILRADENEKYDWIAPVLVACAQANIRNVNFATDRYGSKPSQ